VMNEAVKRIGGECVDLLLPPRAAQREKNADYVFQQDNVVAELKILKAAVFTPAYNQKLKLLARCWTRLGLIRIYGRAVIEMRKLPKQCQEEWLRLLSRPIQNHVVASANKQLEQTNKTLGLPSARGILLLANDSNFDLDPHSLAVLVSRILKKHHSDGSPPYSSIHAVCVFSGNLLVSSPSLPMPALFWIPAFRQFPPDAGLSELLTSLDKSWHECLSRTVGRPIPRIEVADDHLEELRVIRSSSRN
jgi:hypothetical protein